MDISALACARETSGFKRPKASIMRASRFSMNFFAERKGQAEVGM